MESVFSPVEIRVLGCLIEKESTTPEAYPLTVNSLTRACNQKSNREPLMDLSESEVLDALEGLNKRTLVSTKSSSDSRVKKYSHRLQDRRIPEFDFSREELALISVLLLRGAQTPGELRTRCERLFHFEDTRSVLRILEALTERSDGPYVKQLPRYPGQKESRYMHLFAGDIADDAVMGTFMQAAQTGGRTDRIAELELKISSLESELSTLEQRFEEFVKQFE